MARPKSKKDKDNEPDLIEQDEKLKLAPVHMAIDAYYGRNEDNTGSLIFNVSDEDIDLDYPEDDLEEENLNEYKQVEKESKKDGTEEKIKAHHKVPTHREFVKAFFKHRGIKLNIANELNITRRALDRRLNRSKTLREALKDAIANGVDGAQSKLVELMDGVVIQDYDFRGKPIVYKTVPCTKSIQFYLRKQGKELGYGDEVKEEAKKPLDNGSIDNLVDAINRSTEKMNKEDNA